MMTCPRRAPQGLDRPRRSVAAALAGVKRRASTAHRVVVSATPIGVLPDRYVGERPPSAEGLRGLPERRRDCIFSPLVSTARSLGSLGGRDVDNRPGWTPPARSATGWSDSRRNYTPTSPDEHSR
jgi:hypothetical protein